MTQLAILKWGFICTIIKLNVEMTELITLLAFGAFILSKSRKTIRLSALKIIVKSIQNSKVVRQK